MKPRIEALFLLVLPLQLGADSYGTLLQRYERQIREQETQLRSVRRNLQSKEKEVALWQDKAKQARQEWLQWGREVQKTQKQVDSLQTQVTGLRRLTQLASQSVSEKASLDKASATELSASLVEIYKKHLAFPNHFSQELMNDGSWDVFQGLLRLSQGVRQEHFQAQQKMLEVQSNQVRLQKKHAATSAKLVQVHERHEAVWSQWQKALRRRRALEEERQQLEQSAYALRVVLRELRKQERQLQGHRVTPRERDLNVSGLKGTLPWPVVGRVIQPYGRYYSKDLGQLMISNGIRIEANPGRAVRAVQSGEVLFSGPFQQYGLLVIIQHPKGLTSIYGGLGELRVHEKQRVGALEDIGMVPSDGRFYFEIRKEEQTVNPLYLLTPRPGA